MFSSNDWRNAIAGSVLFVALLLACIGGISLYKGSVPVQVEANTASVTGNSLALETAKWQAQAPPAYDITVKQGADQATLHVSDNETNIQVLQYTHAGSPVSNSNTPLYPNVQQMSVQNLFTLVQNSLNRMEQSGLLPADNGKLDLFYDYDVRFNEGLGYPTHIVSYQRETSTLREIIWRESPQAAINVEDFKAAK